MLKLRLISKLNYFADYETITLWMDGESITVNDMS